MAGLLYGSPQFQTGLLSQAAGLPQLPSVPMAPAPQVPFPGNQGGGSVYGQNNLQQTMPTDRYSDAAHLRGGAPLTAAGLAAALGNAMGIMGSGGLTTGIKSMAELAMGKTSGTLGGFQNIPGHFAIVSKTPIRTLADYTRAYTASSNLATAARNAARSGTSFGGGTGNTSVAGGRSVGGFAVGNDGRIAGGI